VASGTSTLTFSKSGGGTLSLAEAEALLDAFRYNNSSDTPTAGNRVVSLTPTDAAGSSPAATLTLTVSPFNEASVVVTGAAALAYAENAAAAVIDATVAKLIAHHKAAGKIAGVDRGVGAGDVIRVGRHIELQCLDTPGHTLCHICLFAHADEPALFSGDTMFNAGAGNVHNGGSVDALFDTFEQQLAQLPGATRLFPGHDYLENNLRFTLDREPDNQAAQARLSQAANHDPAQAQVTTLAQEREHNTFMRLDSPSLIAILRKNFPDLPEHPDRRTVFARLRELRNRW
jgi:hydroxyacylglutathione hydrolase